MKNISIINAIKELTSHICIEQGTSDIWTYRKYADGTAECWGTDTWTGTCTGGNGALYDGTAFQKTFPSSLFVALPDVFVNDTIIGYGWFANINIRNLTSTECSLVPICSAKTSQTHRYSIFAIGKWK